MLNGFDILKSLSAADEHDIADCAEFFNLTRPVSGRKVMKISRTLLIAAIICAMLAVTASAIGLSAYLKHQQELKAHYMVEENQVLITRNTLLTSPAALKFSPVLQTGSFTGYTRRYHPYRKKKP